MQHDAIVDGEAMSSVEGGVDATPLLARTDEALDVLLREYVAACHARRDAGDFVSIGLAANVVLARLRLVAGLHRLAEACGVDVHDL